MKQSTSKNHTDCFQIIPIYSNNGEKIEDIIISAFLKYLKYNDYK